MKTWLSTVSASVWTAATITSSSENANNTAIASENNSPFGGYSTYAGTNHDFAGLEFTSGASASSDLFGQTMMQSFSGATVINTNGFDETVTTEFTETYQTTADPVVVLVTTQTNTVNVSHATTTAATQTQTVTTGTVSTRTYITNSSTTTGTATVTANATTTVTRTQTNITTSTRTTTSTLLGTVTTAISVTGAYWIATAVEAERGDWLWAAKANNTLAGLQIFASVMESFTSSLFGPLDATTSDNVWPGVSADWTGIEYQTATAASAAPTIHTTSGSTVTGTALVYTCLPPSSSTASFVKTVLASATVTMLIDGAGSTTPTLTAGGTTISSVLPVTSWETVATTLLLNSFNSSGFDAGLYSLTAVTTRTFKSTMSDTGTANVVSPNNGVTERGCSFKQTETDLTFLGGISLHIPVSGKGIKLPWANESTLGMFTNIAGISDVIPWASWAMAQQTGVTSPLPPLGLTTIADGTKKWIVSWNSSGLFATESTTATGDSYTTHSYVPSGAGALTQTWLTGRASINSTTRYITNGIGVGGVLPVTGVNARVWKFPGVLLIGNNTATSRVLVTAETFEAVTQTGRMTWGQETAASISTFANPETNQVSAPYVRLARNPSIIP